MGDYNIDLLKSSVHSPTSDFLEMMYDKSFYNLISRPTRITNATATLIDNIYTNSVSFDKDNFQEYWHQIYLTILWYFACFRYLTLIIMMMMIFI